MLLEEREEVSMLCRLEVLPGFECGFSEKALTLKRDTTAQDSQFVQPWCRRRAFGTRGTKFIPAVLSGGVFRDLARDPRYFPCFCSWTTDERRGDGLEPP